MAMEKETSHKPDFKLREVPCAGEGRLAQENIAKNIINDNIDAVMSLKDAVISLEDHLYREKEGILYNSIMRAIEKPLLEHTLEKTAGNQLKAARVLGINRNTIRSKIRKLGIDVNKWKAR